MASSKYTFQDFVNYKTKLDNCANNNSSEIILNDSLVHAVFIYTSLLKKANNDNLRQVNIYCGKASIFRDSTRQKVEDEWNSIKPTQHNEIGQWSEMKPYEEFRSTLETYLQNKGRLSIIIDGQDVADFSNESVYPLFKQYRSQIAIKQMPFSLDLNHFAFVGSSYRCENSDANKTAICCFNASEQTKIFDESFSMLTKISKEFKVA